MSSDLRQQIEDSLAAFLDADLASAAVGLLNALGYQSEKTLDLDNTPDAFLSEFDNRDRKLRKDKALLAFGSSGTYPVGIPVAKQPHANPSPQPPSPAAPA
jgi:hypothetical protein